MPSVFKTLSMLKAEELGSTGGGSNPGSRFQQQDTKVDLMTAAFFPFYLGDTQGDGTR